MDKYNLRVLLENKISKTKKKIEELLDMIHPIGPENSIGRISRIDAIQNQKIMESNLKSNKSKLAKLQYALGALDEPGFGICKKCNRPISEKRILIMPESTNCIRCAR